MTPVQRLPIDAIFWRMLAPRWSHAPLSGEGAARHGGRWNPKGMPTLYMSVEFTTAIAEYEQDIGFRPGTLCAYQVHGAIIDLTDPTTCETLAVSSATLHCPWKRIALIDGAVPPTWDLVARLQAEGAAGIRVPSAQHHGGRNLVIWNWNRPDGVEVKALDPLGDLPRDGQSWR